MRLLLPLLVLPLLGCPPSAPTDGEVSVLTYNVHGLPPTITGDDTNGRMEQIAPLLPAFDWVGLQEDWMPEGHELLMADVEHPHNAWFDRPLNDDRVYGAGLTTLSNAPLVELYEEHYTDCYGFLDGASDCLASKGFQVSTLQVGDAEIDFYNTHLEAGGGDEDEAARAANVEQLIQSFTGRSAGRAVVFVGDMNLRSSDPVDVPSLTRFAEEAGLTDTCEALDCPEMEHIDRIWFRDGGGVTITPQGWSRLADWVDDDGVDLSDHPAIQASLAWSTE